ncbi:ABC transporter permease [Streptomyces sp. NBC_01497]|uniref:ABC transporter permease n=1 Tax=Streptomyces sp. NBC_01497 TaxID=2903885 RepID=UPI002E361BC2|nr:ABC transporter permease [Streptomyces sp. NBC_01497]
MAMAPDTRSPAPGAGAKAEPPLTAGLRMRSVALRWDTAVVILLIAVFLVGLGTTDGFTGSGNLAFAFNDISEVALIALPMTLLVVAGEIDLSVGSMLGFSSALAGSLWNAGWAFETIVPVVLVIGVLGGLLNGWLVTRVGLPSLAVTIGTLALYRGLASVVLGSDAVTDFPERYANWTANTTTVPGTFLTYPIVLFIVLAIVTAFVLHSTSFGRSLFAIGSQEDAAFFAGIRVKRYKLLLFVLTGLFSAFAGIIFTLRYGSARADNGTGYELLAISAILLGGIDFDGGKGTLVGAVAGILLVGVLRNLLTLNDVPNEVQTVVTGLLLVASVLTPRVIGVITERRQRRAAMAAGPAGGAVT